MASATISFKNVRAASNISAYDYSIFNLSELKRDVKINEVLPFRVRFTNIGINVYGPNNVPPIGIAIVGLNNYIL